MEKNEMTAAQLLRKAAEGGFEGSTGETYRNISVLMGASRNVLSSETCRALAGKIEAEIEEARRTTLTGIIAGMAAMNGWPQPGCGEAPEIGSTAASSRAPASRMASRCSSGMR